MFAIFLSNKDRSAVKSAARNAWVNSRPKSVASLPARQSRPASRKRRWGLRTTQLTVNNMEPQKWMSGLENRHYDKAPIREAIIDIQIENSSSLTLANLEKVGILLPQGYAQRNKVMMRQLRGQLEAGVFTATASQDPMGYAFVGGEGKHFLQCKVNGFTDRKSTR